VGERPLPRCGTESKLTTHWKQQLAAWGSGPQDLKSEHSYAIVKSACQSRRLPRLEQEGEDVLPALPLWENSTGLLRAAMISHLSLVNNTRMQQVGIPPLEEASIPTLYEEVATEVLYSEARRESTEHSLR